MEGFRTRRREFCPHPVEKAIQDQEMIPDLEQKSPLSRDFYQDLLNFLMHECRKVEIILR